MPRDRIERPMRLRDNPTTAESLAGGGGRSRRHARAHRAA
jgi:hypothetical protein